MNAINSQYPGYTISIVLDGALVSHAGNSGYMFDKTCHTCTVNKENK